MGGANFKETSQDWLKRKTQRIINVDGGNWFFWSCRKACTYFSRPTKSVYVSRVVVANSASTEERCRYDTITYQMHIVKGKTTSLFKIVDVFQRTSFETDMTAFQCCYVNVSWLRIPLMTRNAAVTDYEESCSCQTFPELV